MLHALTSSGVAGDLGQLTPTELGTTFVTAMYLSSANDALDEKRWLLERDSASGTLAEFVEHAMRREFLPIAFLAELYLDPTPTRLRSLGIATLALTRRIVALVATVDLPSHRAFVLEVVRAMTALSRHERTLTPRTLDDSLLPNFLYRAFDAVDEVFQLAYTRDDEMVRNATTERLYEGSGRSVQTSYETLLQVLDALQIKPHAHLVDLGSGFGRLGLVAGLWRDDLTVTGYEYVDHRVEVASAAAARAGLADRVRFVAQDLAAPRFAIPEADVYYMYDPFSAATYARVIRRLIEIGASRAIAVVTKGNAGDLFAAATDNRWEQPERLDHGNLAVFRSRASRNTLNH